MARQASTVYRVRNLPSTASKASVAELLVNGLGNVTADEVEVCSVADQKMNATRTATVIFKKTPRRLQREDGAQQWVLESDDANLLIVDSNFFGLTPLNEVDEAQHQFNCVAIGGIAGHPFGSWQPQGGDGSYMWIRDVLPARLPYVRFYIYGYDPAAAANSTSTPTVKSISTALIHTLQAHNLGVPSAKPLLLLAHCLGGVVLKQALVQAADGCETKPSNVLDKIKGVIFFGVPSHPVRSDQLSIMTGNRSDVSLEGELAGKSEFLQQLDQRFAGIPRRADMKVLWAYETEAMPTTTEKTLDGAPSPSTLPEVLVNGGSATSGIVQSDTDSELTFPIQGDHMGIVSFNPGDDSVDIIVEKMQGIVSSLRAPEPDLGSPHPRPSLKTHATAAQSPSYSWNFEAVVNALHAAERGSREKQIEERYPETLSWVYQEKSTNFEQWLQTGNGIYWIRGKPGSGKSTLMKYIYNDQRTTDLLYQSGPARKRAQQVKIGFFFHHRGSDVQRSFPGLLRSIVSQILERVPKLQPILSPILDEMYRQRLSMTRPGELHTNLREIFTKCGIELGPEQADTVARNLREHAEDREELLRGVLRDKGVSATSDAINRMIVSTLKKEKQREEEVRRNLQRRQESGGYPWSLEELEKVLYTLFDQKTTQLDICLFLDALDEYIGKPELIAGFLQRIEQPRMDSRNRVRICFSSRPLETFTQQFSANPGFEIHKYTGDDISLYCRGTIGDKYPQLALLVPEIVRRAQGVFVWVRLVLCDLLAVAVQHYDPEQQGELLRDRLSALPDELDLYYAEVINRIDQNFRWETYVILETLSRTAETMSVSTMLSVLALSKVDDYEEAEEELQRLQADDTETAGHMESRLKALSGTLIVFQQETVRARQDEEYDDDSEDGEDGEVECVQLMHQTVKDFVLEGVFQAVVFDKWHIKTSQNGHSFLSKAYFFTSATRYHLRSWAKRAFAQQFARHARDAERTTNRSQYNLITGSAMANTMMDMLMPLTDLDGIYTPQDKALVVGISSGLELYLQDAYQETPTIFKSSGIDFLHVLTLALDHLDSAALPSGNALNIADFIMANGYAPDMSAEGFKHLIEHFNPGGPGYDDVHYARTELIVKVIKSQGSITHCINKYKGKRIPRMIRDRFLEWQDQGGDEAIAAHSGASSSSSTDGRSSWEDEELQFGRRRRGWRVLLCWR